MDQKPLYEISKYPITINKSEEPFFSWQNSVLTVRTEKGLTLLQFSHNLQCMDKQIDWTVADIPSPKTSPATSLFSSKFKRQPMSNFDFTQMTVNPSLWPHNPVMLEELASIIAYEWSPPDFMYNNERVIAILTNVGNVELFGPKVCGFKSVLNISSVIEKAYKENLDRMPKNLEQLKTGVDAVESSALCWGDKHNGAFNFVTAQKNGDVFFWRLQCNGEEIQIDQLTTLASNCGEIVIMQWISLSSDNFVLLVTNTSGQLLVYKYKWDSDNIKLIEQDCLWSHKDRMVIRFLKTIRIDNKIVLICNKHRHLLLLLLDENCQKISEWINNVNDYKITSISENNKDFFVTTINCKVYKVTVSITSNSIEAKLTPVVIKENFTNKEMFGIQFSKNNVMCAIAIVDRKIMFRKENVTVDMIFLCQEVSHEKEIACLLNNPSNKLTDYWDCIELLRYKTMKLKTLPTIDYGQLYFNNMNNLYKMKVYCILLILYNTLEKILKNGSKGWLPQTSLEAIREKILALHASCLINELHKKSQSNIELVGLEADSFVATKKYLKYFCQKYKLEPTDLVSSEICNTTEVDCKYMCQCCDEVINGFSCVNGHLNMFCALTLTPIETDHYLACKGCGVVARIELLEQKPMCVFCDLYLNYYLMPN